MTERVKVTPLREVWKAPDTFCAALFKRNYIHGMIFFNNSSKNDLT